MLEVGKVIQIGEGQATVEIKRNAACGKCGMCQISEDKKMVLAQPRNAIGAKVGDTVKVEMEFSSLMKASIIAYLVPLVFFLAGCVIGFYKINIAGLGFAHPVVAFCTGLVFLAASYGIIKLLDYRGAFRTRYTMDIIEIIEG